MVTEEILYRVLYSLEALPEGFQTAEFVREHGGVDLVVPRKDLKNIIGSLLSILLKQKEFAVEKEDDNTNALEKSIPKTSKAV